MEPPEHLAIGPDEVRNIEIFKSPTGLDLKYGVDDDGHIRVVDLSPRGAAEKAGVWIGAEIVRVNGTEAVNLDTVETALREEMVTQARFRLKFRQLRSRGSKEPKKR